MSASNRPCIYGGTFSAISFSAMLILPSDHNRLACDSNRLACDSLPRLLTLSMQCACTHIKLKHPTHLKPLAQIKQYTAQASTVELQHPVTIALQLHSGNYEYLNRCRALPNTSYIDSIFILWFLAREYFRNFSQNI